MSPKIIFLCSVWIQMILATESSQEEGCKIEDWKGTNYEFCEHNEDVLPEEKVFWEALPHLIVCHFTCVYEERQVIKYCENGAWQGPSCRAHPKRVKRFWRRRRRRRSPPPPPPDTTPPTISCPQTIYKTAPERQTSAIVTWSPATAYDSRDGTRPTVLATSTPPGGSYPEGSTLVTYSASDTKGNTNYCSFYVHVSVIRCPSPTIASPGSVQCSGGGSNLLGTQCTFNCSGTGYTLMGHQNLECLYFGYWDLEYPTCSFSRCGHAGNIRHGYVSMTGTKYGDTSTYSCSSGHLLIGDSIRTCQNNGTWSGKFPLCRKDSCSSSPCNNGATCRNTDQGYECVCPVGISGEHCDQDISPPRILSCPKSVIIQTRTATSEVSWNLPEFDDPTGQSNLTITSNYVNSTVVFPLGSHMISYTAVKLNNGLSSQCNFTVDVRATPCDTLNKSGNSVLLCNDWQVHALSVCIQVCQEGYEPLAGYDEDTVYVCGGSGQWLPTTDLPNCIESPTIESKNDLSYTDCIDQTEGRKLSRDFIKVIQSSPYNYICKSFLCNEDHVNVICR